VGFGTGGPINFGAVGGGGTRNGNDIGSLDPFSPLGQFPNPAPSQPGVSLAAVAEATATTTRRPNSATTCAIRQLRGARLSSSNRGRGRTLLTASSSGLGHDRVSSERRRKEPAWRVVPCVHSAIRHLRCPRLHLAYLHSAIRPPARRKRDVLLHSGASISPSPYAPIGDVYMPLHSNPLGVDHRILATMRNRIRAARASQGLRRLLVSPNPSSAGTTQCSF